MAAPKNPVAGPGRKPGFKHAPQTVALIKTSMILQRLHAHIEGKVELSPTQVTAATVLLRKSVPDLSSVEHKGNADMPLTIITRAE